MHTDSQLLRERSTYAPVQSRKVTPSSEFRLAMNEEEYRAAWLLGEKEIRTDKLRETVPPELLFTFVHLQNSKCVGMLSVIRDSSLGLPGDQWGGAVLEGVRSEHKRIAEIAVYSILPSPIRREMVLAQLTLCALRTCEEFGISGVVVNPWHEDSVFLEGLLGFTKVGEVNGNNTVGRERAILGIDLRGPLANWRALSKRFSPSLDRGREILNIKNRYHSATLSMSTRGSIETQVCY